MAAVNDLKKLYTSEYVKKIFYFCLKKTGNECEADDLTQDISLCIFSALSKGTTPMNFSAWVWRIAKNRYSLWADKKHRKSSFVSEKDADFEPADEAMPENELIKSHDMMLLRRELAFISSEYREIIVAFYIDDIKAKEIASRLNLPESTVRSKLLRARKILKEGMSMARSFGKLSYNPENVDFIMNGICGSCGEPYTIINHLICKNILLAAYRTPSKPEELAIELGTALPYITDELERLVNADLLRKNGNKYETNMVIISAGAQEKIYTELRKTAPRLTKEVTALLDYEISCNNENNPCWNAGYQRCEDAKWALLMKLTDEINFRVLDKYNKNFSSIPEVQLGELGHTLRPDGGEWDLLGLEGYTGDRPEFVGLHGCTDYQSYTLKKESIDFRQFRFNYKGISDKTPAGITYEEGKALTSAVRGDISGISQTILETLVANGYLKKEGVSYTPTFLVIRKNCIAKRTELQEKEYQRLLSSAVDAGYEFYMFCRDIVCSETPDFFRDSYQINHACANIYCMRGAVLEEALRTGYITYTEEKDNRMLGAHLII